MAIIEFHVPNSEFCHIELRELLEVEDDDGNVFIVEIKRLDFTNDDQVSIIGKTVGDGQHSEQG